MSKNEGFSLVELMVILAALGGVAMIVTKLGRNSASIQNEVIATNDYNDLNREAHFLIENLKSCKVSLAGTNFKLDNNSALLKNLELWTSDSKGSKRIKKKFSANQKVGSLTIEDITLKIVNENTGVSAGEIQSTTASIKVALAKTKTKNPLQDIEQSINLSYTTNSSDGMSTIVDCENIAEKNEFPKMWCGQIQNPCGSETMQVIAIGKYEQGKFTGILEPTMPIEYKYCHAVEKHPATFTACGSK